MELEPIGRTTLIANCQKYIGNPSFNDLIDVLERNIVDQLYQYIDDIYKVDESRYRNCNSQIYSMTSPASVIKECL